jgi:pyruvate/2-oxoglutarate dehydrogenase complex dihydrolipoamide dehydrogenase (E3) component
MQRAHGDDPRFRADMARVRRNVREVVEGMVDMNLKAHLAAGLELVMGTGRFVAPRTIAVQTNDGGERVFEGEQVFINTGTVAAVPDVPGLKAAGPLTHVEALQLDTLAPHMIVIGGGYIGLEMAQAFRRLGSDVT